LVKRESLAALARSFDLGQYLSLGAGELRSGGQARDSILADTLEAVFAAVYLDSGYPSAREVILNLFRDRLTVLTLESQQKDPKTRLQEYLQALKYPLPDYRIAEVSGDQHAQIFQVACVVPELGIETLGTGSSRRRAEQDAAAGVLKALNLG
jgi:ribonuclease-3